MGVGGGWGGGGLPSTFVRNFQLFQAHTQVCTASWQGGASVDSEEGEGEEK